MEHARDIAGACFLLLVTVPLMLFVALLIKLGSSGPIMERREFVGRKGRHFQLLNFRITACRAGQPQFRPQITRLGRFLRDTRIEHLPQLINVLQGDMSLDDMSLWD